MSLQETINNLRAVLEEPGLTEREIVARMRAELAALSPFKDQPVDSVQWVPLELVDPNDYNPNAVARIEMGLLRTSIHHDGYTQPVVTVFNEETGRYVIVDGFHRYFVLKTDPEINARTRGMLPVVVLRKGINDRMASTVRHNRARGKHSVSGMSSMVFQMLENGWTEEAICNELGMSPEELVRLKHITGFSRLFEDAEYRKSWVTRSQIRIAKEYRERVAAGEE